MRLIKEEKINQKLRDKEFLWEFEIDKQGVYGIKITASAKSWWQNLTKLRNFFKDDDLIVIIDEISFSKTSGKRGFFDSEIAWNGNNLKGLKKTNLFLIKLQKGAHTLKFLADQSPNLKTIRIYQLEEDETQIDCLPKDNYPIEDGNKRQWLTIILCNLGLQSLKITASAKQGKTFLFSQRDDSDLKLIINGEIQKNEEPKSHKNWFWCGRTLKEKEKIFEKELNLKPDIHYIEFWADRNPEVKEIKIGIKEISFLPTAKVVWEYTNLRKEANVSSGILISLKRDKIVEVLEKARKGERPVVNEKGDLGSSDRWHKVSCQNVEGYIYSEALEIEGESKERIENFILQKSEELKEDKNLMLVIAKAESQFFPYTVGQLNPGKPYEEAGKGVMQINDITAKWIRESGKINYHLQDIFDFKQNVEGGIGYFKYLRTLYKEDDLEYLEKLLISWNCGPDCIKDKDKPIDYSIFSPSIKKFVDDVKKFYQEYKKENKKGFVKPMLLLIGSIIILVFGLFVYNVYKDKEITTKSSSSVSEVKLSDEVKKGSLFVSTSTSTSPAKTVNYGTKDVELLKFNLTTDSTEDINISGIAIEFYSSAYGEVLPANLLKNLKLFYNNNIQYGSVVPKISSEKKSQTFGTSYVWFYDNLVIPKNSALTLKLVADIPQFSEIGYYGINSIKALIPDVGIEEKWIFAKGISDHFVAKSINNNNNVPNISGDASGNAIYFRRHGSIGSLTLSTAPDPSHRYSYLKGTKEAKLLKIYFVAGPEEDIQITKVTIKINRDVTNGFKSLQLDDLTNIKLLKENGSQFGSTINLSGLAVSTNKLTFFDEGFIVKAGTTESLTVVADISSTTTASSFETFTCILPETAECIVSIGINSEKDIVENGGANRIIFIK